MTNSSPRKEPHNVPQLTASQLKHALSILIRRKAERLEPRLKGVVSFDWDSDLSDEFRISLNEGSLSVRTRLDPTKKNFEKKLKHLLKQAVRLFESPRTADLKMSGSERIAWLRLEKLGAQKAQIGGHCALDLRQLSLKSLRERGQALLYVRDIARPESQANHILMNQRSGTLEFIVTYERLWHISNVNGNLKVAYLDAWMAKVEPKQLLLGRPHDD
jgi:hypothetical protein